MRTTIFIIINKVNIAVKFEHFVLSLIFLFLSFSPVLSIAAPVFTSNTQKLDLGESGLNDMVAADFNQDGAMDVIISEYDGGANGSGVAAIEIRFGDSNGSGDLSNNLSLAGPTTGDGLTFNPDGLAVGDIDGDGVLDVAITAGLTAPDLNNTHLKTLIFLGEITGVPDNKKYTLLAATPVTIITPVPAHDVVIGLFNNDAFVDVVIAHELGISLFTGTGGGAFSATEVRIAKASSSNYPRKLLAVDINNDQILDIVTNREVLLNDYAATKTFVRQTAYGDINTLNAKFKTLTVGDFNNDKLIDIAYVLYYTTLAQSELVILQAERAAAGLNYVRKASPKFAATKISALASGDVDLDGNIDVLMTDYLQDTVYIFTGVGDGTFSTPSEVIITPAINALPTIKPKLLVAIKANNDRLLDIVTANDVDGQTPSLSTLLQAAPANELVVFQRQSYEILKPVTNQNLAITVSRKYTSVTPPAITVYYTINNGSAINGVDFNAATTATDLVFNAGQLTQTFTIEILATNANVAVKNFTISLTDASGLLVPANEITSVAIVNNNIELPLISFESLNFERNEDSTLINVFVSVTRTLPAGFQNTDTSAYLSTQALTIASAATAGSDFTPIVAANLQAPNIVFTGNQTTTKLTVPIEIINDNKVEPTETFRVFLSQALNATISGTNYATVTIIDDDIAPPNTAPVDSGIFSLDTNNVYTVSEDSGELVINVIRNSGVKGAVVLNYLVTDNTAQAGVDFNDITLTPNTLNFADGVNSMPIRLQLIKDNQVEANENFTISLISVDLGVLASSEISKTVTIVDATSIDPEVNPKPTLSLPTSASSGGGCSLQNNSRFDPMLLLLVLFSLLYFIRNKN